MNKYELETAIKNGVAGALREEHERKSLKRSESIGVVLIMAVYMAFGAMIGLIVLKALNG